MRLSIKDILTIAVLAIATFPLIYVIMLFLTGYAKVVLSTQDPLNIQLPKNELKIMKHSNKQDSLVRVQSELFQATEKERKEIEVQRTLLTKQKERIIELSTRLDAQNQQLAQERKKFEAVVTQVDSLEEKKIKQLAKIYAAMRPNEAARIMETLDEKLIAKLLAAMNDDRQKGKIIANFSQEKATRISSVMSKVKPSEPKAH